MSFLSTVIASAEKIQLEQIVQKIPELLKEAEECKVDLTQQLENFHAKFTDRPTKNKKILKQLNEHQVKLQQLVTDLEQIVKKDVKKANDDIEIYLNNLKKTAYALSVVKVFCEIHEGISFANEYWKAGKYYEAFEKLTNVETSFKALVEKSDLVLVDAFLRLIEGEKSRLRYDLVIYYDQMCVLLNANEENVIKINTDGSKFDSILKALYLDNTCLSCLDNLTKFLWDSIFLPIVETTTEVTLFEDEDYSGLKVVLTSKNFPKHSDVLKNIGTVLDFLMSHFSFQLCDDLSTLRYIGRDLEYNLGELLSKRCIQVAVPTEKEQLKSFEHVISEVEHLEEKLLNSGIVSKEVPSIVDYAKKYQELHVENKCKIYVERSKAFMEEDLHETTSVGLPHHPEISTEPDFLQCQVSKSALKLLTLIEEMLKKMEECSRTDANRILRTIREILLQYVNFVPEFHKKWLQTIPQQVALFHNNCAFIAFSLHQYNVLYSKNLSSILENNSVSSVFRDETFQIQKVGEVKFKNFIDEQTKSIVGTLKNCGLGEGLHLSDVDAQMDKAVRQCLRQQELLKTVWHKVLQYGVYNKSLGLTLNVTCETLIDLIVKYEDIETKAAERLSDLLKVIGNRGPKLFTDPKEISLFVANWNKFNELIFVLNANLMAINDRWADGKGPLALYFSPSDLKQLIRALFQNTDRRAAVLSKIH